MLVTTQFAIISAERHTSTPADNLRETQRLSLELCDLGLSFKQVEGVYGGTSERSFLVRLSDSGVVARDQIAILSDQARAYAQDCILHVDASSQAWLIGACDEPDKWTHLGKWQQVTLPADGNIPIHWDAYTHDPAEDTYYVAQ